MKKSILLFVYLFTGFSLFSQQLIWSKPYGGSQFDMFENLQKINGVYYHTGTSNSVDGHTGQNNGAMDAWIMVLNATGDSVLSLTFGGSDNDYAKDIIEARNGLTLITGYTASGDGDFSGVSSYGTVDGFAYLIDSSGNAVYKEKFGGSTDDRLSGVIKTFYKGFLFLGMSSSSDGLLQENLGTIDAWAFAIDISPLFVGTNLISETEFEIYPNPSSGLVNLKLKQPDGKPFLVEIFTADGKKVKKFHSQQTASRIDMKDMKSGLYFIRITTNQSKGVKRFLVF
ncbi:MAG: T9SS type A sorting domain-containing protein [Bacteroidales bacterium]|nr:T9SS type A sorting domain-containing protein [Bacteroidales bacterium]